MALPIRDGNQSLTTLSTLIISNSHVPAHTVVSFGTQGITDIATAVSGVELGPNTLNALENITVTLGQVTITGGLTDAQLRASSVTIGGSVTATISGTSSVTFGTAVITGSTSILNFPTTQTVTFGTAVITGSTSIIGTPSVTFTQIATHGVTIGSGTAQIGSVTASISGTVSVSGTFYQATQPVSLTTLPALVASTAQIGSVTVGNSVTIGSLPSISGVVTATMQGKYSGNYLDVAVNDQGYLAVVVDNQIGISELPALASGTNQIGSVTASISNSVVTFYPMQGTSVSSTNFTSTTPSTTLVSAVAGREVLSVFNEGAGNLHISAGATCTTIAYQVRLSAGDYWECPAGQTSLAHTAVFATAGTARVTQVS